MSEMYVFNCDECNEYGHAVPDPVAARFDALSHEAHPMAAWVRRTSDNLVVWRPEDGLGEDGQAHIH